MYHFLHARFPLILLLSAVIIGYNYSRHSNSQNQSDQPNNQPSASAQLTKTSATQFQSVLKPSRLEGIFNTEHMHVLENTEDGTLFQLSPTTSIDWESLEIGDSFTWDIAQEYRINGIVDSLHQTAQSISFGVTLDSQRGRVAFQKNNSRQIARLFFNKQRIAHRLENDGTGWQLLETTVSELRCASSLSNYPVAIEHAFPKKVQSTAFISQNSTSTTLTATNFESRPGAPTVIYCDFDGETINQPDWSANTITAVPSGLSNLQIASIMQMVAEDFAPFDVNVTNVRSVFDNTDSDKRVMVISTPTDDAQPGSGGVAFLDSFIDDLVCWNFNLNNTISAADTISHEVGHTLNLEHDGYQDSEGREEYYDGHSAGKEFWVPIMGSAYSPTISQWSKGEYFNANQTEDDLVIMSQHGISFRTDDFGNSSDTAHTITLDQQIIRLDSIINQRNDIDVFTIEFTDLGQIRFETVVGSLSTNLDVRMRVYDSSSGLLIDYDSEETKKAGADLTLQAGTYQVWIEGDSNGSPNSNPPTGWTDYGSLGAYTLTLTPAPPSRAAALDNFGISLTDSGNSSWFTQSAVSYDGFDALQSGAISDNESSNFVITQQTTSINFRYKVSSEQDFDFLQFRINGQLETEWSGEISWAHYTKTGLSNSTHTFEWRYVKDDLVSDGQDSAWIDALEFSDDSSYASWANSNSTSASGSTDENGNGTLDLLDYAIVGYNSVGLSQGQIVVLPSNRELQFYRNPARADIVIRIQVTDSLETWETVAVSQNGNNFYTKTGVSVTQTTIDSHTQKISLNLSAESETKKFARVLVSKQ